MSSISVPHIVLAEVAPQLQTPTTSVISPADPIDYPPNAAAPESAARQLTLHQVSEAPLSLPADSESDVALPLLAQFDPTPTNPVDPVPTKPDRVDPQGEPAGLQTVPRRPDQKPFTPTQLEFNRPQQATRQSSPGVTIITPSAYGLPFRYIGVGAGVQSRTRYTETVDGSFGVAFGLGDPYEAVGLNISLISFSSFRSGFLERGTVNFKVNRYLPHNIAIAAGVNNGLTWGKTDSSVSPYGVITKQFVLHENVKVPFSRVYISAGVGGGQFRLEEDVFNRAKTVGAFGGVTVRVVEPISLISEWSGQDLTLGLSVAPLRNIPLVFTPAVTDITGTAGDGSRFIFGIGYGTKY